MKVVVAMSGGVDSSVAAFELRKKGYDLIGITIKTWSKEECGEGGDKLCCSLEAIQYARSVAEDIDIPYYVVDFSSEFTRIVKKYFSEEYACGRTPNPCIYCNSMIKFGLLLNKAHELGAGKVATGHYARIVEKNGEYFLFEAADKVRDQSYFLYDIPREKLPFIEFPLGDMDKTEVRNMARKAGLMPALRKDSQDICFASAEGDYRDYLISQGVKAFSPGNILDISGRVIGRHKGIASYTIGQRKGLGIAVGEPVYVLKIDSVNNTITVGSRTEALNNRIRVGGINWLTGNVPPDGEEKEFGVRIRYNGEKARAVVERQGNDKAVITFLSSQFAPTPGQAAVIYDSGLVVGGGWIEKVLD